MNWIQTEATSFTSATPVSCLNHTAKFIMLNCFSHLLCPANSQLTFGRGETSRTLNLKCWWMLQGSDMDYLPAPPHPFPQVLQEAPHQCCYHPGTPYIGKSWSHGLFSSWLCHHAWAQTFLYLLQNFRIIQAPRLPQHSLRHLFLLSPDKNS